MASSRSNTMDHRNDKSIETLRSWVIMVCSGVLQFVSAAPMTCMSLFLVEWMGHFGTSRQIVSIILAINMGILMGIGPLTNALAVRYGFHTLTTAGSVLAAVALVISSFATSLPWLFCSYSVIAGIGYGMMSLPGLSVIPLVFDQNLITASSSVVLCIGFGSLFYPYIFYRWISAYGWRTAMVYLACMVLQGAVAGLLIRQDQSKLRMKRNTYISRRKQSKLPIVIQPQCLCLYASSVLGFIGIAVFFALGADYLLSRGLSAQDVSFCLALFGGGSITGRFICIVLGRFLQNKSLNMTLLSVLLRAGTTVTLPICNGFLPISINIYVCGVAWGFYVAVALTSVVDIVKREDTPAVFAGVSLVCGLAMSGTPPLASWVILNTNYSMTWFLSTGCSVFSAVLCYILIWWKRHNTRKTTSDITEDNQNTFALKYDPCTV